MSAILWNRLKSRQILVASSNRRSNFPPLLYLKTESIQVNWPIWLGFLCDLTTSSSGVKSLEFCNLLSGRKSRDDTVYWTINNEQMTMMVAVGIHLDRKWFTDSVVNWQLMLYFLVAMLKAKLIFPSRARKTNSFFSFHSTRVTTTNLHNLTFCTFAACNTTPSTVILDTDASQSFQTSRSL